MVHGPHDSHCAQDASGAPVETTATPTSVVSGADRLVAGRGVDPLALLRASFAEMNGLARPADYAEFFAQVASRANLRMLLLKRWRSGLQVILERNVALPQEAKSKRTDGRAPIPFDKDDIFSACAEEVQVYAGPVPAKHFPLDLTLLLGRGARDRRIVLLPLPSRDHWNTFVYLDADHGNDQALTVAELLAYHALTRLQLLQHGEMAREGKVAGILKLEQLRRRERTEARRARLSSMEPADPEGSTVPLAGTHPSAPVVIATPGDELASLASDLPASAIRAHEAQLAADNIVNAWEAAVLGSRGGEEDRQAQRIANVSYKPGTPMDPQDILHRSGELPALPKAAVHILSVIEDPRTTATRLERAVAMDQALTAKILRIANSPFYGAVREIKTVSEAIVRLGFVTIRNWTLVTATKSVFLAPGAGLLFQKIWRQSVISAMAGQLVAQALSPGDPETAFLGGLMQNIGQLVLARSQPELFQQVLTISAEEHLPYHVVEQEMLGFDHGDLGALLINEWNLSEELEQAVRWHHRLEHPDAKNRRLAAMIALGEEVAACTGSVAEDLDLRWEQSQAAAALGVPAGVFSRLREQARTLSIDPGFFS